MTLPRFLSLFIIAIIIIITIGVAFLYANRNALVKEMIVDAGSQALGTLVSVGDVDVRPFDTTISISDFSVQNPAPYPQKEALSFKNIFIQFPSQLSLDPFHIQNIIISKPRVHVFYEKDRSNLDTIIAHTQSLPSDNKNNKNYKIKIDSLTIHEIKTSVTSPLTLGKTITFTLPSFSFQNIGKEKGVLPQELATIILTPIKNKALGTLSENLSNIAENIGKILENTFKDAEDGTKNLIDEASRTLQKLFNN